jgi:hypothetical protein
MSASCADLGGQFIPSGNAAFAILAGTRLMPFCSKCLELEVADFRLRPEYASLFQRIMRVASALYSLVC